MFQYSYKANHIQQIPESVFIVYNWGVRLNVECQDPVFREAIAVLMERRAKELSTSTEPSDIQMMKSFESLEQTVNPMQSLHNHRPVFYSLYVVPTIL